MPANGFTNLQKRIALTIFHNPKTDEELVKELGASYGEIASELRELLKLNLITKSGYPLKYSLAEGVGGELSRRKELAEKDPFKLRLNVIIEAQGIEEALLVKKMGELEEAMKKEKGFTVYNTDLAKPVRGEDGNYSVYLEASLSVKDFSALVRLMYFYGPSSVEVEKPSKIEFSASDLQEGLVLMANMIQSYNHSILKLMTRKELDEFYKKFFNQPK